MLPLPSSSPRRYIASKRHWCKFYLSVQCFFLLAASTRGYSTKAAVAVAVAAFLIRFNVILPSLESFLSPLIHLIEFQSFFSSRHWLMLNVFVCRHISPFNITIFAMLLFFSSFRIYLWSFLCFAQFVHCVTFEMKLSCTFFNNATNFE